MYFNHGFSLQKGTADNLLKIGTEGGGGGGIDIGGGGIYIGGGGVGGGGVGGGGGGGIDIGGGGGGGIEDYDLSLILLIPQKNTPCSFSH